MFLSQTPACGTRLVFRRGDLLEVTLAVDGGPAGDAWLRTNVGRAAVQRREIIDQTDAERPPLARDWHDLPMTRVAPGRFRLRLPLLEPGVFEAKAFLDAPGGKALWPAGENLRLRVLPAHTVCANAIYNAFPRQFGPATLGRSLTTAAERHAVDVLDGRGYAVIPPSGTFRDLARRLDVILGQMGFRYLQLLPVHPVPTTFARLGRYGSPFAVQDFFGVDPGMAEFDRMATPMAQFEELLEAAHRRGAHVLLDLPANHTGWASWLQLHYPEWFRRSGDGSFVSPGAWGVVWEDLCQLDFGHRGLWRYMAEVFLHWCRKGVDGFRCDAGYMVPLAAWRYIVARTRAEYPDTVFFLEGLGGPVETTTALLGEAGLDWAYSEMFQSLDAPAMRACLDLSLRLSHERVTMVHFAETHDNNRLAATSKAFARFRCALSALLSHEGAFGVANGVEWYATEKIDVHGSSPLNWGARENQLEALRQVNRLLREHPAFHAGAHLETVAVEPADCIGLLRRPPGGPALLVLANPDEHASRRVSWPAGLEPGLRGPLRDRLGGQGVPIGERGDRLHCELAPLTVLCLEALGAAAPPPPAAAPFSAAPEAVLRQQYRALALEAHVLHAGGLGDVDAAAAGAWVEALRKDPRGFLAELYGPDVYVPCVVWQAERDERRVVPVPSGHMVLVQASRPFLAELRSGERCHHRSRSLPAASGGSFTLIIPGLEPLLVGPCELHLQIHARPSRQVVAPLRVLPAPGRPAVRLAVEDGRLASPDLAALCSSDSGSMAQVRARWGEIQSQYDALFAANLHPDHPVDRTVLFTRCRAWVVHRDYSQEVGVSCQTGFRTDLGQRVRWDFMIPVGMGRQIPLAITLEMAATGQGIVLQVHRAAGDTADEALADEVPVTLILRPDLESRGCHQVTRALDGSAAAFPSAVQALSDGFVFAPAGHRLVCRLEGGRFVGEPEWQYRVPYPVEQSRGLAEAGDLFSPGYFTCELVGGQAVALSAGTTPSPVAAAGAAAPWPPALPLEDALQKALRQFLVRRDGAWTVLAGYPWFLDWGRDTLIVLRGVIAAGRLEEARAILRLFARFEKGGSLPNMIHGADVGNRDTSDAPLWLSVAVDDYRRASGRDDILDDDCGGRSLRRVLADLAQAIWRGTEHGVRADPETGLVFSPAHFTWMDTNHPAATPREGFPIEIQALWYKSLRLLDEIGAPGAPWGAWASRVRAAVIEFYARGAGGGLCDCLHGAPGIGARRAEVDDACRPNQLLAVTLGLIDDRRRARQVVEACGPLLVPGGLRSLADAAVTRPLAVRHRGKLLNDPQRPYWGRYEGDEDTRRKPAYHNGTAWSWLYPSYAEAVVCAWGASARPAARGLLEAMVPVMEACCLGQIPEIVDGDAPHAQRGCSAQAWGVSELLRVLLALSEE